MGAWSATMVAVVRRMESIARQSAGEEEGNMTLATEGGSGKFNRDLILNRVPVCKGDFHAPWIVAGKGCQKVLLRSIGGIQCGGGGG